LLVKLVLKADNTAPHHGVATAIDPYRQNAWAGLDIQPIRPDQDQP
jgi:hypothetical protein